MKPGRAVLVGGAGRAGRAGAVALVAAVALPGLTGCGGGEVITAGDATVLVSQREDDGATALGGGRLELVGGCLGADGVVIVWPHGTDVTDDAPLTIDIPRLGSFTLGEKVALGGGMTLEHSSKTPEPGPYEVAGVTVPAGCAAHDIFLAGPIS